jgi:hypothetical protein
MKIVKSLNKKIQDQGKLELNEPNIAPETVDQINTYMVKTIDLVKDSGVILSEIIEAAIESGSI